MNINCKQCGKEFKIKPFLENIIKRQKYCSRKCYGLSEKGKYFEKRIKLNCKYCNKEFFVIKSRLNIAKFCSKKCKHNFQKGKRCSKSTEFKKGNKSWSIGLTKETDERLKNCSEIRTGQERLEMRGDKNPSKRLESRKKIKEWRKNFVTPFRDTLIELKIQNFLRILGIEYITHFYVKEIENAYQSDIFIPSMKLIIECDGDFIHCNPEKYPADFVRYPKGKKIITAKEIWEKDKIRTNQLIEAGYKVIRLWGNKINSMKIVDFEILIKNNK
jgi:very-short-patch-repair endonuclease